MKNWPIQIKIVVLVLLVAAIYKLSTFIANPGIDLYNNTKKLELAYDKTVQEQITNYDGYYLAFIDKVENADINKETFIYVTTIIMENRKDGQNVAWKWLQENQNIPYHEFTSFYHELSSFISERYQDNMKIERMKQSIVQEHNTMLQTFPNNIYNRFINIDPLVYKFGYVSQQTKTKFKQ